MATRNGPPSSCVSKRRRYSYCSSQDRDKLKDILEYSVNPITPPAAESVAFGGESEEPLSQIIEDPSIEAVSNFAQLYSVVYEFLMIQESPAQVLTRDAEEWDPPSAAESSAETETMPQDVQIDLDDHETSIETNSTPKSSALSSSTPASTPVRVEKVGSNSNSSTSKMLNKVLSKLEESNKHMNKMYSLVKKHEELLSKPTTSSLRERRKHIPIIVRVSGYI